jgi:hypothetical protein
MRMYGDFNNPDGPEGDTLIDQPADWLDSAQDELVDSSEADLGDGGFLKPWKTSDI